MRELSSIDLHASVCVCSPWFAKGEGLDAWGFFSLHLGAFFEPPHVQVVYYNSIACHVAVV